MRKKRGDASFEQRAPIDRQQLLGRAHRPHRTPAGCDNGCYSIDDIAGWQNCRIAGSIPEKTCAHDLDLPFRNSAILPFCNVSTASATTGGRGQPRLWRPGRSARRSSAAESDRGSPGNVGRLGAQTSFGMTWRVPITASGTIGRLAIASRKLPALNRATRPSQLLIPQKMIRDRPWIRGPPALEIPARSGRRRSTNRCPLRRGASQAPEARQEALR